MFSLSLTFVAYLVFAFVSVQAANTVLCEQFQTVTSPSGQYEFGNNAWGDDGSGAQCISVDSKFTAFNATWKWTANPFFVHGYPNVKLIQDKPIELANLTTLNTQVSWSLSPSSQIVSTYDAVALSASQATANIAFDMFLDLDSTLSQSTTKSAYEVMVWLGVFGGAVPLGAQNKTAIRPTQTLGSNIFTLYSGPNAGGTMVYTWLPTTNITQFSGDIAPLIRYLERNNYLSNATYLGDVQFGSEVFHSTSNLTFAVKDIGLSINKGISAATSIVSSTIPTATSKTNTAVTSIVSSMADSVKVSLWALLLFGLHMFMY